MGNADKVAAPVACSTVVIRVSKCARIISVTPAVKVAVIAAKVPTTEARIVIALPTMPVVSNRLLREQDGNQ